MVFEAIVLLYDIITVFTTIKPVLSGHSKIDKTKILMTNGSLMKVISVEHSAILTGLINQFSVFSRVAVLHKFHWYICFANLYIAFDVYKQLYNEYALKLLMLIVKNSETFTPNLVA